MARLPQPGGDSGDWGTILNTFLTIAHNTDGTLKNGSVAESTLASAVQLKLNNVQGPAGPQGPTGPVGPIGPQGPVGATGAPGSEIFSNVMSYGAKGDGSTDDTAAIQAAINTTKSTGGTVFLPRGNYILSSPLILYGGVSLLGEGVLATTIHQWTSTADGITGVDLSNVTLSGFKLQGVGSGSGCGIRCTLSESGPGVTWYLDFSDAIREIIVAIISKPFNCYEL